MNKLEGIIKNNQKPRKRHFNDVRTSLASTFYWRSHDHESFVAYMKLAGWTVRLCDTKADVARNEKLSSVRRSNCGLFIPSRAPCRCYKSFRHRRWLEAEKEFIPDQQSQSTACAEFNLPALRDPGTSAVECVKKLEEVELQLSEIYNGTSNRFKKYDWDKTRAKHVEYQAIAASLLGIMGGSIGQRRDPANPILIGVGLGQFKCTGRLSSPYSSFLSYFVPMAHCLGYIVVGLNEYYTSKKCPDCENFVAQVTLRELYCPNCRRYHHRDVMAAENMSRIIRGYLTEQKRPRYLQPKMADGRYPWEDDRNAAASTSISPAIGNGTGNISGSGRKRSSNKSGQHKKKAKIL